MSRLPADHFNISNSPPDPEDKDYLGWFIDPAFHPDAFPAVDGNVVQPYISGAAALDDMGEDFANTDAPDRTTSKAVIYILSFESSLNGVKLHEVTLQERLRTVAGRNVLLRSILNADETARHLQGVLASVKPHENLPLQLYITQLGGISLWDDLVPPNGAHHEKLVLIKRDKALVAYCGGVDLAEKRDNEDIWHDVHCRIDGPASYYLFLHFQWRWRRWFSSPAPLHPSMNGRKPTVDDLPEPARPGPVDGELVTYRVQIVRTYKTAQAAHTSLFALLKNAISKSKEFIYVEDQFAVCDDDSFIDALKARLQDKDFKFLVILTTDTDVANGPLAGQAEIRRAILLKRLRDAVPDKPEKVVACARQRSMYVHSKTWIFDDKFAIIGSANMNNRSYFHDGEIGAGIADQNKGGDRLLFAHRLRMALWMKHLDITESEALNPVRCVDKWRHGTNKILPLKPTIRDPNGCGPRSEPISYLMQP